MESREARSNATGSLHSLQGKSNLQQCGVPKRVTSSSNTKEKCPAECPLFAGSVDHQWQKDSKSKGGDETCDFMCVRDSKTACYAANPKEPIPDEERGICRTCLINACDECADDGSERCKTCAKGYQLMKDGTCDDWTREAWSVIIVVICCVGACVCAWAWHLWRRGSDYSKLHQYEEQKDDGTTRTVYPYPNQEGLDLANKMRSRTKLRREVDKNDPSDKGYHKARELWPIMTSMLSLSHAEVAGPGIVLHFHFQIAMIVWALAIAWAWNWMANNVDPDLNRMGTRAGNSPRNLCIIVQWGYEVQHRLMYYKVTFCLWVYVLSFIFAILFSISQLRSFQNMDKYTTTFKDFCLTCTGLPTETIKGTDRVEEELQTQFAEKTGRKVIGVSVCWDLAESADKIDEYFHIKTNQRDPEIPVRLQKDIDARLNSVAKTPLDQKFFRYEQQYLLGIETTKTKQQDEEEEVSKTTSNAQFDSPDEALRQLNANIDLKQAIGEMKCFPHAFVVFETEEARDEAFEKCKDGITFKGAKLEVAPTDFEPDSVYWMQLHNSTNWQRFKQISYGICIILFALFLWVIAFYVPYANFATSFNYNYGQEPDKLASYGFSFMVTIGNAIMYNVCAYVADSVGFKYVYQRETCYMMLYVFACVFNIVLDLAVEAYVGYYSLIGQGVATYHGVLLEDLHDFKDIFEAYAMQRRLGKNLWEYCWPSFTIGFLVEPFATIYLPYKVFAWLIRSHPEIAMHQAEAALLCVPMDLGRYADIIQNMLLAVLVFFFPGGYTVSIFACLCCANVFIYLYDRWKVLRAIPQCNFVSITIDWWAQWMLSFVLAVVIACVVFKNNCEPGTGEPGTLFCARTGWGLLMRMLMAFGGHLVIHTAILLCVVPLFGVKDMTNPEVKNFQQVNEMKPCSWFTANPAYCIRSELIYKHEPPCDFYILGKEHLMRVNESANQYFTCEAAEAENFDEEGGLKDVFQETQKAVKDQMNDLRKEATRRMEEIKSSRPNSPTHNSPDANSPHGSSPGKESQEEHTASPSSPAEEKKHADSQ